MYGGHTCNLSAGEENLEDPPGLLARQTTIVSEPRVLMREPVSEEKSKELLIDIQSWSVTATHMHTVCTHTHTHVCAR